MGVGGRVLVALRDLEGPCEGVGSCEGVSEDDCVPDREPLDVMDWEGESDCVCDWLGVSD